MSFHRNFLYLYYELTDGLVLSSRSISSYAQRKHVWPSRLIENPQNEQGRSPRAQPTHKERKNKTQGEKSELFRSNRTFLLWRDARYSPAFLTKKCTSTIYYLLTRSSYNSRAMRSSSMSLHTYRVQTTKQRSHQSHHQSASQHHQ
jgi:hypothetical protein